MSGSVECRLVLGNAAASPRSRSAALGGSEDLHQVGRMGNFQQGRGEVMWSWLPCALTPEAGQQADLWQSLTVCLYPAKGAALWGCCTLTTLGFDSCSLQSLWGLTGSLQGSPSMEQPLGRTLHLS